MMQPANPQTLNLPNLKLDMLHTDGDEAAVTLMVGARAVAGMYPSFAHPKYWDLRPSLGLGV